MLNAYSLFNSDHKEYDGLDIENFSISLLIAECPLNQFHWLSWFLLSIIRRKASPFLYHCVHHSTYSNDSNEKTFRLP